MSTAGVSHLDDLRDQVVGLIARTRTALQSDDRAEVLASALPVLDDAPLRIALAGPHNAGKSMLIAAMLQLPQDQVDAITGAVPLTDTITPYDWMGCTLLDLPGTLSGLEEHEAVAAAGIRKADLLLLVSSVELPGEAETEQIRRLLGEEGFARRVLVVLNKCNSEDNDPDVVRTEMLSRLEPFDWIEPIFADAKDYVNARNAEGLREEDREAYSAESGIDEVTGALTALADEHGPAARLQALCHEVRRIAATAAEKWEPNSEEQTEEIVADRIRAALASARQELTAAANLSLETLGEQISAVGNRLAGAVSEEDASVSQRSADTADADEAKAAEQFTTAVNKAVGDVLDRLDAQLDTTLDDWDRYTANLPNVSLGIDRGKNTKKNSVFVDDALEKAWNEGMAKTKGALDAFIDGGVREGSKAHDAAKRLKKIQGGGPAKPHEYVNRAKELTKAGERINTAAQFVGPLIDVRSMIDSLLKADAAKKRRASIRSTYAKQAREAVALQRAALELFIDARLALRREVVAAMLAEAEQANRARTEAQAMWREHAEQASALARLLDELLAG